MDNVSSRLKRESLVILLYSLLALLFTYPLVFKAASHVAYEGTNDAYYCLWSLWWSKTALFDLHTNPLFTGWLFYPQGTSILFGPTMLHATAALASPIQVLFPGPGGLILTYNIVVFVSLALSAYGAYLLANHICGHRGAAFIAGLIYAFVPLRLLNMVRLQYFSLHWIPFFALFFIKTLEEDKKRNPLLAALFLSLILFDSLGYALEMVFFGILTVPLVPIFAKKLNFLPLVRRLAIFVVFLLIFTLPHTIALVKEIGAGSGVYQAGTYGVSLDSLVVPPPKSTLYNMIVPMPEKNIRLGPFLEVPARMGFLRYSVIILVLYSTYLILRHKRALAYWPIIAAFYLLMSLGPRLTINNSLNFDIPMPYDLLRLIIPFLKIARTTGDYLFHFALAASVICAVGLATIFTRIDSAWKRSVLFTLVAFVVIAESLVIPIDVIAPQVTTAYERIKNDPAECTVAEFPLDNFVFLSRQFLYQTYHRKKLLGGLAVRPSPGVREFLENPFIKYAEEPRAFVQGNPLWMRETLQKDLQFLEWTNLKYVVVNKRAFRMFRGDYGTFIPALERYLNLHGFVKTYEDRNESIYLRNGE